MGYWAVVDSNNNVVNCIIADNQQIAEEVTGLTCIEYFLPKVGDILTEDKKFISNEN